MTELLPWIYGGVMASGLIFLLVSILFGDIGDVEMDVDMDASGGDARSLGCMVIAAFMAGFGSVGLMASFAGWDAAYSLLVALVFGLVFGRSTMGIMRWVLRQQSNDLLTGESLVGAQARITVNIPPGQVGEAMVTAKSVMKYPVVALDRELALHKGDIVQVEQVLNGRLVVTKIES